MKKIFTVFYKEIRYRITYVVRALNTYLPFFLRFADRASQYICLSN